MLNLGSLLRRLAIGLFPAALVAALPPPAATQTSDEALLHLPEYAPGSRWAIIDSRWGFVARFNFALAERLDACGNDDQMRQAALIRLAPHRFGGVTEEGINLLSACDPSRTALWWKGGQVTTALWRAIAPDAQLPTVLERTHAIAFRGSGLATDYDVAFWTGDAPREAAEPLGEVFIWGPARASVSSGCYVQRIIRRIAEQPGGQAMLEGAFADLPEGLAALRIQHCPASLAAVAKIGGTDTTRQAFRLAIKQVGASVEGRRVYYEAYMGPGGPWAQKIARLYRIYAEADLKPTEADFAMFFEAARGLAVDATRLSAYAAMLRVAHPKTPAHARRALFQALSPKPPAVRDYELGRAVAYYIDGIGEAGLTDEELAAWRRHGRVRASDVGLSDRPYRPPCEVLPDPGGCPSLTSGDD